MPVPSSDRVLIHLLQRGEPKGWTGGVSDQDLIAVKCGIGRTHIPRVVRPLIDDEKVIEELGRSPGRQRRVKVYSLSFRGRDLANSVLKEVLSMEMKWKDDNGQFHEGTVEECHREINSRLFELSLEKVPLSLFISLSLEDLKWNDIIWMSTSILKEMEKGPETPAGWRRYRPRERIEGMPFSREQLEEMDRFVKELGIVLIKGIPGSGKKDMIGLWLRSRKRNGLWLEKGEGEEGVPLEGGPWDTLILLDGGDPGVESLLMDEVKVKDPRGDDWGDELRSLDLIMTTDANIDPDGPMVEASGISSSLFLDICMKKGLGQDLSQRIYDASKGSSRAIRYIAGLSEEEIDDMGKMDADDAVMRVLLAIK